MINELLAASQVANPAPKAGKSVLAILYVYGVKPAVTATAILPLAPPLHVAPVTDVVKIGSTAGATANTFVFVQPSAVSVIVMVYSSAIAVLKVKGVAGNVVPAATTVVLAPESSLIIS